jgi:hypothetical protein
MFAVYHPDRQTVNVKIYKSGNIFCEFFHTAFVKTAKTARWEPTLSVPAGRS